MSETRADPLTSEEEATLRWSMRLSDGFGDEQWILALLATLDRERTELREALEEADRDMVGCAEKGGDFIDGAEWALGRWHTALAVPELGSELGSNAAARGETGPASVRGSWSGRSDSNARPPEPHAGAPRA